MRFVAIALGVLLVLFGGTYWVLFSTSGNKILMPFIEKKAQEAIGAPFKIELFRLTPNLLKLEAVYQNSINAKVEAKFSLFAKSFDVDYRVFGDKVVTPTLIINESIDIEGNAKGSLGDFYLKGIGVVFEAPATYEARVSQARLANATINVENASVEKLLGLAAQPLLTKARANLRVNIVEKNGASSGTAELELFDGVLDSKVVEAEYSLKLPPIVTYQAVVKAFMEDNKIKANGVLDSNLAKLAIKEAKFNISTKVLGSRFDLHVKDLSKLVEMTGVPLQGSFDAKGDLSFDEKNILVNANSASLGGNLDVVYSDDKVFVKGKDLDIEKILFTLVQPLLAKGKIELKADIESIENTKGVVHAKVQNGNLSGKELKALVDLEWPNFIGFETILDATIDKENINFKADLQSDLANIDGIKGSFDTKSLMLESIYDLHVKDLSKLSFMTGQVLKGSLEANGKVKLENDKPYFDVMTDVLGGKTLLVFENDTARLEADGFSMERISEVADVPYVFKATGSANAKYNISEEQGEFSIQIPQGHLLDNELVRLVQVATRFNMLTETYTDTSLKGIVKNQMVGYDFAMQGKESFMKVAHKHIKLNRF